MFALLFRVGGCFFFHANTGCRDDPKKADRQLFFWLLYFFYFLIEFSGNLLQFSRQCSGLSFELFSLSTTNQKIHNLKISQFFIKKTFCPTAERFYRNKNVIIKSFYIVYFVY